MSCQGGSISLHLGQVAKIAKFSVKRHVMRADSNAERMQTYRCTPSADCRVYRRETVKILIILIAMGAVLAGALHTHNTRNLYIQAAQLSEAFNLSAHVKLRVADHYVQHGVMPHDNNDAGLPPPKSIYGTSVKRVAINRGGVLIVDFDAQIGRQAMTFTPTVSPVSGLLSWQCTSDSIDNDVLDKLKPNCSSLLATDESQLMHAIANRDVQRVGVLLVAGAQPDAVVNGNTPLMLAAKVGNLQVVEKILEYGAKVDNSALNSERRTPLMVSITSNNAEVVALLLGRGASVTRKDYKGMTALDHAVTTDRRFDGDRYVLMVSARFNPQFAGTPKRLKERQDPRVREVQLQGLYTEFRQAAMDCHVQRLSSLLLAEKDLDSPEMVDGVRLSQHIRKPACGVALLQFLPTKSSYQRALKARMTGVLQRCDTKQTETLLRDNPALDINRNRGDFSHFQRAVAAGCTDIVALMVRDHKMTGQLDDDVLIKALRQAPQGSLVPLIGALLAAGANVNVVDGEGQTALAAAIALEQPVVAKYLVDAGADVNVATENQSYPLIEATKKGYEHLVSQLIAHGAELNPRDSLGRTALLAAVARGRHRLVNTLIRAGASTHLKDTNGIDALVLAESKNYRQIQTLLMATNE